MITHADVAQYKDLKKLYLEELQKHQELDQLKAQLQAASQYMAQEHWDMLQETIEIQQHTIMTSYDIIHRYALKLITRWVDMASGFNAPSLQNLGNWTQRVIEFDHDATIIAKKIRSLSNIIQEIHKRTFNIAPSLSEEQLELHQQHVDHAKNRLHLAKVALSSIGKNSEGLLYLARTENRDIESYLNFFEGFISSTCLDQALIAAIRYDRLFNVSVLLQHGANFKMQDLTSRESALSVAVKLGRAEHLKLLLKGQDLEKVRLLFNTRDRAGKTLFYYMKDEATKTVCDELDITPKVDHTASKLRALRGKNIAPPTTTTDKEAGYTFNCQ